MGIETFITSNLWLAYILIVWEVAWTGVALWRSARRKHTLWFIVFLVLQLLAIPEIIYMIVTSKKKGTKKPAKKKKK